MNEKLSFQHLVDALSAKANVSKKVAETFSKAFFDTVVDALYMGESSIKVKGLGTFKLIEVESRESVNVSNGERIVIPGYKKVSFVPEDSVVESLNRKEERDVNKEIVNAIDEEKEVTSDSIDDDKKEKAVTASENVVKEIEADDNIAIDNVLPKESVEASFPQDEDDDEFNKLLEITEPVEVETPSDALSGIDLLISTPESIEEVRRDYEAAQLKADEAIEVARKANAERMRLKKLLESLEKNASPEIANLSLEEKLSSSEGSKEGSQVAEDELSEDGVSNSAIEAVDENVHQENGESYVGEESAEVKGESGESGNVIAESLPDDTLNENNNKDALNRLLTSDDDKRTGRSSYWIVWLLCSLAVFVLISCIVFFMYKTSESIESVEQVIVVNTDSMAVNDSLKEAAASVPSDSLSIPVADEIKKDSVDSGKEKSNASNNNRPKTYVLKTGDSLTKLSVKFYGTKDSLAAIIKANGFENPNNVLIGTTILLP